jgi:hypothetical protein
MEKRIDGADGVQMNKVEKRDRGWTRKEYSTEHKARVNENREAGQLGMEERTDDREEKK